MSALSAWGQVVAPVVELMQTVIAQGCRTPEQLTVIGRGGARWGSGKHRNFAVRAEIWLGQRGAIWRSTGATGTVYGVASVLCGNTCTVLH